MGWRPSGRAFEGLGGRAGDRGHLLLLVGHRFPLGFPGECPPTSVVSGSPVLPRGALERTRRKCPQEKGGRGDCERQVRLQLGASLCVPGAPSPCPAARAAGQGRTEWRQMA